MVIFQIHVAGVASGEEKSHPPVGPYCHRPHAFTAAFQWVQSKCRLVHILHVTGLIERRKDQSQTVNLIGCNSATVILFKQAPEALVFEAPDHRSNVKRQLTFVNTKQPDTQSSPWDWVPVSHWTADHADENG
jgi:hypothetical protein